VLDAPIIRSGKLIGFVRLEQTGDPISWTPDEQVFATAVASLIAMVCENRDRLLVEGELRTSNHALEAATKAKSEFLATMSHEIRTPMNGVLGMLEVLLDSDLTEQQRDVGNTARKAAQSLLVILNDILDLSRVEAGAVSIEERSFDLPALVEDVVDLLAPEVSRKGLTIDLEI
jgi:signal transduction histidine kinase